MAPGLFTPPLAWVANDSQQPTLAFCLSIDANTRSFLTASQEELVAAVVGSPSVIRRIRTNKAPALSPLYEIDEDLVGLDLDVEEIEEIGRMIRQDLSFCTRLAAICQQLQLPWPVEAHVEKQIYGGFWGAADDRLLARFHEVDWPYRLAVVEQLEDERLKLLGLRLLYQERPDLLTAAQRNVVSGELAARMAAEGPLTIEKAIALSDGLLASCPSGDVALLREYRGYLMTRQQSP